eukprot:Lankesteria_metandrocarpae@DN3649_c0_g1_i1.p1
MRLLSLRATPCCVVVGLLLIHSISANVIAGDSTALNVDALKALDPAVVGSLFPFCDGGKCASTADMVTKILTLSRTEADAALQDAQKELDMSQAELDRLVKEAKDTSESVVKLTKLKNTKEVQVGELKDSCVECDDKVSKLENARSDLEHLSQDADKAVKANKEASVALERGRLSVNERQVKVETARTVKMTIDSTTLAQQADAAKKLKDAEAKRSAELNDLATSREAEDARKALEAEKAGKSLEAEKARKGQEAETARKAREAEVTRNAREVRESEERKAREAAANSKKAVVAPPVIPGGYSLKLKNIYISHGDLSPSFDPNVLRYTLQLPHKMDRIALTPVVFKDRPEYQGGESNLPRAEVDWYGSLIRNEKEITAVSVKRQIDMPRDTDELDVKIRMSNPHNPSESSTYVVRVVQPEGQVTTMRSLEASDEEGNSVRIHPIPSPDQHVYTAYVVPDTKTVLLRVDCYGGWATIDKSSASNNVPTRVRRDLDRYVQLVDVTCGDGKLWNSRSTSYFVRLISQYPVDSILPPTSMMVPSVGRACSLDAKGSMICPNPNDKDYKSRVVAQLNPQIRYTIASRDGTVDVRLLDNIPSVPFNYRNDLYLKSQSGEYEREWPISFSVPFSDWWVRAVGWICGFGLELLLVSLVGILSYTSILGIGLPVGVTEVAATLTLLLQYFCFSNGLRGNVMLSSFVAPFKWVTLFWPVWWQYSDRAADTHIMGDTRDIVNANGCLIFSSIIIFITFLIHSLVMAKMLIFERDFTFPHRLLLGGIESRLLHWLIFPTSTAATMIIMSDDTSPVMKGAAYTVLIGTALWIAGSWALVKHAVANKNAIWVWNTSMREENGFTNPGGYWTDAVCDQVATEPANRSIFSFFEWKWTSAVGDIDPVQVAPGGRGEYDDDANSMASSKTSLRHDQIYAGTQKYAMAKSPKSVEIYRTRAPGLCCPGQRLMVGLFPTQWLDLVMSYHAVTKFYAQAVRDQDDCYIPLVVKTHQLQGPITAGRNAFFFDGVRVPFCKIADCIFRLAIGILMGVALASSNFNVGGTMFLLICLLSATLGAFVARTSPYSRPLENYLYFSVLTVIALSSFSFMVYAYRGMEPSSFVDFFLWCASVVALVIAAYSYIVTFSLYSALLCPPLEESRFIETLSNCAVSIADHVEGWMVDVPGYSKYLPRSLKVQCNPLEDTKSASVTVYSSSEEATLEFSVDAMRNACRTGTLPRPIVSLNAASPVDPLGYSHLNVYDRGKVSRLVNEFLSADPQTRNHAHEVARVVSRQLDSTSPTDKKSVMCLTLIPPRFFPAESRYTSLASDSGFDWSTTTGSSRSDRYSKSDGGELSAYTSASVSSRKTNNSGLEMASSRSSRSHRYVAM